MPGQNVHHISLAAGSGTLHLLQGLTTEGGYQSPVSLRRFPSEHAVFHFRGQVQALRISRPVSLRIGFAGQAESHQPFQFGIRKLFGVFHFYLPGEAFSPFQLIFRDKEFAGRIFYGNFRSAERPAGAGIHIDQHTQPGRFPLRMPQHFHPTGRKERNIVRLISLHSVDRGDFHRPHTCRRIGFEVTGKVFLIHRATHPPPAGSGLGFCLNLRPGGVLRRQQAGGQ